jgi:hypothetical protein
MEGEDMNKDKYLAQIVSVTWEGQEFKPGQCLAEYTIWAVSQTGAMRAATQWYNRQKTDPFERFEGVIKGGSWEFMDMTMRGQVRLAPVGTEALVVIRIG